MTFHALVVVTNHWFASLSTGLVVTGVTVAVDLGEGLGAGCFPWPGMGLGFWELAGACHRRLRVFPGWGTGSRPERQRSPRCTQSCGLAGVVLLAGYQ